MNRAWLTWIPRVMFMLVPFFAWLVALAYRRVDGYYLHHLVFALHIHAAWFAAAGLAAIVALVFAQTGDVLESLLLVTMPIYAIVAFRHVYGRARRSFARIVFVLFTYWIALTAAILAIVLPVVFGRIL